MSSTALPASFLSSLTGIIVSPTPTESAGKTISEAYVKYFL